MRSDDGKTALVIAQDTATMIVEHLRPGTERIEIAGSVRREKERVKDIELVLIPKPDIPQFGSRDPAQWARTFSNAWYQFLTNFNPHILKSGTKYKQIECSRFTPHKIDVFIVTPPAEWGTIFFIRTGPAEWNMEIMKRARDMGMKFENGRLWGKDGMPIRCPEEEDVFHALDLEYIPPSERN